MSTCWARRRTPCGATPRTLTHRAGSAGSAEAFPEELPASGLLSASPV
jgi:hypothetical protein